MAYDGHINKKGGWPSGRNNMKKKLLSLLLVLILAFSALPISAFADLPGGFWPYLEAWANAKAAGNEDEILSKGTAYLDFLAKFDRNQEIADNQYNVRLDRLDREIYEKRNDWDGAIANTKELISVCEYLQSIGVDRQDMITRCKAHLKVIEPFIGVYAASYTQSNAFGSKYAAASGTYYGTIAEGSYGESSICSFYVELETETAEQYAYRIAPRADGTRVILINLNYQFEGETARTIPTGIYDDNITTTLSYLATLEGPVLMRIGGEMDLWSKPEEYKASFRHIAAMADRIAPNVELVWSPNYAPSWEGDVNDFYPGDDVVDWVGMSLYYNAAASFPNARQWDKEYFGFGEFSDSIRNADNVMKVAIAHNKPAIATEGGAHHGNGEAYAALQSAKEYSTLTMVYPQIKAIVYFDKIFKENDYRLVGNIKSAVDAAIASNPSLIHYGESSAATFVPIDKLDEKMSGTLILGATGRTYHNVEMSATWTLDGKATTTNGSPNQFRVDLGSLSAGKHKLEVTLNDGKGYTTPVKTYTLAYEGGKVKITSGYDASAAAQTPVVQTPKAPEVVPTNQNLTVNGVAKSTEIYNIDGSNYFKLRDIAALLNGTGSQFSVGYDDATKQITVTTGKGYEKQTSDLSVPAAAEMSKKAASALISSQSLLINGKAATGMSVFNIGGNNYFKLRDLGTALNFGVDYDSATKTMIIQSK